MRNSDTNDLTFLKNSNIRILHKRNTLMRNKSFRFTRDNSLVLKKFTKTNSFRKKRLLNKTTFHTNSIFYKYKSTNTPFSKRRVSLIKMIKPLQNNYNRSNVNFDTKLNYLSFLNTDSRLYRSINRPNELYSLVR